MKNVWATLPTALFRHGFHLFTLRASITNHAYQLDKFM